MIMNDEVARRKEKLRELINRTSDYIKFLSGYADPEIYPPDQRKPVINKIRELQKYIQKILDELKELDK